MAEYPIIREGEYYLSIETEHFYFDVYKAWNGTGGGAMFRAGSYIKKKGDRKYYLDYELFAEWDYKDKQTAFEEAKKYIFEYMKYLGNELQPTADVEEVKHGYWFIIEYDSFHCSICGKDVPSGADSTKQAKEYLQKGLVYPYCPRCGAKMDGRK